MAVLSLLKPTLGYRGIVLIVAGVAGLTVVAAFWFFSLCRDVGDERAGAGEHAGKYFPM